MSNASTGPEPALAEVEAAVRPIVADHVAPAAAAVDRDGRLAEGVMGRLGAAGLFGLAVPAALGGGGQPLGAVAAATGVIAEACGSTAWAYLTHAAATTGVAMHGSDALRGRYLGELLAGARLAAMAGTEAGGGTNPMGTRTRARVEGDAVVLDGAKAFISLAGDAGLYLVMARTSDDPGPQALSLFAVPAEADGLSCDRREDLLGVRGVPVGELRLDGVRVPADHRVGPEGGALTVLGVVGGCGVAGATAAAIGIAAAAVEATAAYLRERSVAGQVLAGMPAIQQQWVEVLTDLEACRGLQARALAAPPGPPLRAWMAKARVTEVAQRIVDRCLQLHGAMGYSRGLPLERMLRDARAWSIHWGNNDTLRSNAGRMALG